MEIKDIGNILSQFEPEDRFGVLDKILDYGLKVTEINSAATVVEREVVTPIATPKKQPRRKVEEEKPPSTKLIKLNAATRNISVQVHNLKIKDNETKNLIKTAALTFLAGDEDKLCDQEGVRCLVDLNMADENSLMLIAGYLAPQMWREDSKYGKLEDLLLKRLGRTKCIEAEISHQGYSDMFWERWVINPLLRHTGANLVDRKTALSIVSSQWFSTRSEIVSSFTNNGGSSNWFNRIIQMDVRLMDVLVNGSSLKHKVLEDEETLEKLAKYYIRWGTSTIPEREARGERIDMEKESKLCLQQMKESIAIPEYKPVKGLISSRSAHQARTLVLWNSRKKDFWVDKYQKPWLEPFEEVKTAIYNVMNRELQSKQ